MIYLLENLLNSNLLRNRLLKVLPYLLLLIFIICLIHAKNVLFCHRRCVSCDRFDLLHETFSFLISCRFKTLLSFKLLLAQDVSLFTLLSSLGQFYTLAIVF